MDLKRLNVIVRQFDDNGLPYTATDICEAFASQSAQNSLFRFMENLIAILRKRKKTRTAETYKATLISISRFIKESDEVPFINDDIRLDSITSETVEAYESYLKMRGNCPNTTSFYMRILRAIYNKAADKGIIERSNPFRHVYTGVDKTVKRALSAKAVSSLRSMDLHDKPKLDFARDMFILSFFLRGMSFIDMAFLKKTDLQNGQITYRRRKTGQLLRIQWTSEMQKIVDKYPVNHTCHLLPILTAETSNEYNQYRTISGRINLNLKKLAGIIGIKIPLSLYCARHSWASIARTKGIPVSVISGGMGHSSEKTTQIYLATIENSVIDRANSKIISSV